MKSFKQYASLSILVAGIVAGPVLANSEVSRASAHSSAGISVITGSVVVGSIATAAHGSQLVVDSVEKVGDSVVYVFKNVSTGVTMSVKAASSAVGAVSVGVGTVITVVADASGHALMASGKVIAFIPNEIGKSLIHSKKSVEREARL